MGNFVLRTVRHGRVKVKGKWFVPDDNKVYLDGTHEPKYEKQLDGQRFAFGLYEDDPVIVLWGTEALYRAAGQKDSQEEESLYSKLWKEQPNVLADGLICWMWWHEEKPQG